MDIYLLTTTDLLSRILKNNLFTIRKKKNHYSAVQYVHNGRYHILYAHLEGEVFCDFHFDNKIHFIGMGADYGKKPGIYFEDNLKRKFNKLGIKYKIKKVNWFTRRNKAIITGYKI